LIVFKLSPYESMGVSLSFFLITLLKSLTSTFTVFGFYFRVWLFKNEIFYKHINIAFRQGLVLALVAIFCLIFQMMRVLNWWSGILLLLVAVLLESYFSSKDSEVS
jgi:hypothetical protein